MPVLTAIVISALLGAVEFDMAHRLLRADRKELAIFLAAFLGVLVLGTIYGVVIGVLLSMGTLIWRASRPHIATLGRLPGSEHFRNIERYAAQTHPQILLLRGDGGKHLAAGLLNLNVRQAPVGGQADRKSVV